MAYEATVAGLRAYLPKRSLLHDTAGAKIRLWRRFRCIQVRMRHCMLETSTCGRLAYVAECHAALSRSCDAGAIATNLGRHIMAPTALFSRVMTGTMQTIGEERGRLSPPVCVVQAAFTRTSLATCYRPAGSSAALWHMWVPRSVSSAHRNTAASSATQCHACVLRTAP